MIRNELCSDCRRKFICLTDEKQIRLGTVVSAKVENRQVNAVVACSQGCVELKHKLDFKACSCNWCRRYGR